MIVHPEPADAKIVFNGKPLAAGRAVPWPNHAATGSVSVEKKGFRRWTKKLSRPRPGAERELYPVLRRKGD